MADPQTRARLDRECAAYARYLTGHAVAGYVLGKYADAHQRHPALNAATAARFDSFLLSVAAQYPLGPWLVDAYTAVFFKSAVVRKKWVLLVAILESAAPTAQFFDRPDPGGLVAAVARLAWRGVAFVVGLLLSSVLFLPVQLLVGRPAAPSSPAGTH